MHLTRKTAWITAGALGIVSLGGVAAAQGAFSAAPDGPPGSSLSKEDMYVDSILPTPADVIEVDGGGAVLTSDEVGDDATRTGTTPEPSRSAEAPAATTTAEPEPKRTETPAPKKTETPAPKKTEVPAPAPVQPQVSVVSAASVPSAASAD